VAAPTSECCGVLRPVRRQLVAVAWTSRCRSPGRLPRVRLPDFGQAGWADSNQGTRDEEGNFEFKRREANAAAFFACSMFARPCYMDS
jgi:hypothetical protein